MKQYLRFVNRMGEYEHVDPQKTAIGYWTRLYIPEAYDLMIEWLAYADYEFVVSMSIASLGRLAQHIDRSVLLTSSDERDVPDVVATLPSRGLRASAVPADLVFRTFEHGVFKIGDFLRSVGGLRATPMPIESEPVFVGQDGRPPDRETLLFWMLASSGVGMAN